MHTDKCGYNVLSWADNTDKFIKTFNYDTQGRLANADIPGVSRTDYGYDWVGNRTSPTAVYNDADQLTSYNGNTYTYYGEGGMINGAGRTFGYLPTGDPYQVSLNGTSKNGRFDPHGLREVTYGAATTKYSYDITASTPAMISEGPNDGTTTYFYVREPNGELIMRKSGTDYKYYHFDELGSTLFLTDANGIQTDKYVYNAWGKVVSSSGSTVNPYRYIGKYGYYYDTETNLYLLGKRYYDADAGVFCQRDAAKDGLSYYAYTSGKEMTATDPWGKSVIGGMLGKLGTTLNEIADELVCKVLYSPCISRVKRQAEKYHTVNDKLAHCYAICQWLYECSMPSLISWFVGSVDEGDPNDRCANNMGVQCTFHIGSEKWGWGQRMFGLYPSCLACCLDKVEGLPNDPG